MRKEREGGSRRWRLLFPLPIPMIPVVPIVLWFFIFVIPWSSQRMTGFGWGIIYFPGMGATGALGAD